MAAVAGAVAGPCTALAAAQPKPTAERCERDPGKAKRWGRPATTREERGEEEGRGGVQGLPGRGRGREILLCTMYTAHSIPHTRARDLARAGQSAHKYYRGMC